MKIRTTWSIAAAGICLALTGQVVQAAGDAEAGKKKFYTCAGCHGIRGYSNTFPTYAVPKLGGQYADYLVAALKAYQNGSRKHGSMEGNTVSMSEQDIQDIAAYLSRFRSITENNAVTGNAQAGKTKAETCGSCHGEDGNSQDPNNPRLAAQYESYLVKALHDYKSGARKNAIMSGMVGSLSEQDIKDIAAFYASQKKGLMIIRDD
jgi:cytochrome c553